MNRADQSHRETFAGDELLGWDLLGNDTHSENPPDRAADLRVCIFATAALVLSVLIAAARGGLL